MTPNDAAKIIIGTLISNGVEPDVYVPMDLLADELIDVGMAIEDIESGLTAGCENGWFELLDSFITFTEEAGEFFDSSEKLEPPTVH